MSAYREPDTTALLYDAEAFATLPEVSETCPECFASLKRNYCRAGHETSTRYNCCDGDGCSEPYSLRMPRLAVCGPNSRRRSGWFWLRTCQEPGTHLHQECDTCGWRWISKPRRETT